MEGSSDGMQLMWCQWVVDIGIVRMLQQPGNSQLRVEQVLNECFDSTWTSEAHIEQWIEDVGCDETVQVGQYLLGWWCCTTR